jgi:hypothetical protein
MTTSTQVSMARRIAPRPWANVPFGEGDAPIREVLRLLKQEQWSILANIEFEYPGDPFVEVPRRVPYCRAALA